MISRRGLRLPIVFGVAGMTAWLLAVGAPGCGDSGGGSASAVDAALDAPPSDAPFDAGDGGDFVDAGPDAASFAALVDDPSRWKPIANPGACNLHEGNVVPDPFPKREWSACGPGCLVTTASLPFAPSVGTYAATSAADYVSGGVYMTSSFGNPLARITRLERLPEGTTIAATMARQAPGTGVLARLGGAAPFMFLMLGGDDQFRFGRAPKQAGQPIAWQPDWRSDANGGPQRFVFDDGIGVGTPGGPLLMEDDTGAVVQLPGGADRIVGRGKQLVWAAGYTPAIHGYTKAKGHVELVPLPGRGAIGVALSDERIVWMSGVRVNDQYTDRRWHWSPRVEDPADVVVHDGPTIDGSGPLLEDIKTGGDWAAATRCLVPNDLSKCQVIAWNMATNQTVAISGRPGAFFWNVLAVSPTELYLGEIVIRPITHLVDNIVRLETSALSALAAGAGWAQ